MVTQLGNFLGRFLEYDSKAVALGYTGTLRIRVRIDVGKSLRRKEKVVLPNGVVRYVRFAYEKLTLFCFLCGKMGRGESSCPLRVLHSDQDLSLGGTFRYGLRLNEGLFPLAGGCGRRAVVRRMWVGVMLGDVRRIWEEGVQFCRRPLVGS